MLKQLEIHLIVGNLMLMRLAFNYGGRERKKLKKVPPKSSDSVTLWKHLKLHSVAENISYILYTLLVKLKILKEKVCIIHK